MTEATGGVGGGGDGGGVCDLCGDDHQAGSCIEASHSDFQSKCVKPNETQLAYQSLPGWVEVQERSEGEQVVVKELVPRLTKLGPLIAPHTPQLPPHTSFPLKICHKGGGHTFLDLSRKWLCNWLSLIPVGSPTNHNLLVCQIDDLIYYVSTKDIEPGSELVVWYAPFYQPKVYKELQEMGMSHSITGAAVVTKVIQSNEIPSRRPMVVSPSLARIVVGGGEVNFTHHDSVHQSDPHQLLTHHLTHIQGKCDSDMVTLTHTPLSKQGKCDSNTVTLRQDPLPQQGKCDSNRVTLRQEALPQQGKCDSNIVTLRQDPLPQQGKCDSNMMTLRQDPLPQQGKCDSSMVTLTHTSLPQQAKCDIVALKHTPLAQQDKCDSNMLTLRHTPLPQQAKCDSNMVTLKHTSLPQEDKCDSSMVTLRHASLPQLPTVMLQGLATTKKHSLPKKVLVLHPGQSSSISSVPSIQLVPVRDESQGPEYVVRLTITAASEACQEQGLMGQDILEDIPLPLPRDVEGTRKTPIALSSHHRRKYRQLTAHKAGVSVAGSDMVKQLPPRALGARDPRPWTCMYCGHPYTCLLTFTTHLKAHLLWLVGRCHVCEECGISMSSTESLQRHQQAAHGATENALSPRVAPNNLSSAKRVERKRIKSKTVIEDEEENIDDPNEESHNSLKRISALPTKPIEGPHTCQICTKSFHKPQYLLRHLRKHSGDFTCQSCLKVFARKESLMKHICPAGGEETCLSCPVCGRSFLNPRLLHQHQLKHQGTKKCERCGRVVSSSEALKRHMTTCPSVQVAKCYQCEVCGKQLATIKQLDSHRKYHHQQHHCHLCNKPYSNSFYLARHMPLCRQSHQLSSVGRVSCEVCGKEFTDATAFRTHHHTHTHPFKCSGCNHRFQTRVGFEVHACEVEQQCDQCGTTFRSIQALNRHAAVHGPPPHSCKVCRRSYYRKESLDRHKCSVEADVKKKPPPPPPPSLKEEGLHICSVCGVQLANRRTLTSHLRSAHGQSNGKVLKCETCGKGFHRRDLLRQHQSVHGPASLPCPTCHKLFKTHKSLEVHSLIHLNIKRFVCKYCNKKFHQKINLIRHEKSHLPRGTVKCQYCALHYSSPEELKAHLLSHTFPQGDQEEQIRNEPRLTLTKKESHHSQIQEDREVLLPHFTSNTVVESPLKYMSESKSELGINQSGCEPDHVLAANSGLEGNSDELKLIVKEGTTSGIKSEINKECPALVPEFRTKVVHNVVPVMTSQLTLQAAAVTHSDVASHSTVFLPQRLSNFSLSAAASPLSTEYLASPTSAPSPNHIGNSSVFKVTNDSLNTEGCRLPSNVLITSATVPALEGTEEECHLGDSVECYETVETEQEVPLPSSSQESKVRQLTLSPGSTCLYQATAVDTNPSTGRTQVQDCHMLSGEQIVQSVVIVAEPPVTGC